MTYHTRSRLRPNRELAATPGTFLTDDQIRRVAPSVFAETAHESRSDRFAPIPTSLLVQGLRQEGFDVVSAMQSRSRDVSRIDFTKHMLRLRRVDATADRKVGDVFPEVVLVNANDGSSCYVLSAGLFRLICLNGMTTAESAFEPVRVSHMGDVVDRVIEGTYTVLGESIQALNHVHDWSAIQLNDREQLGFAEAARVVRFGDADGNVSTPITAEQLLQPRRYADGGNSLWQVFNRVQENAVKGGLHGYARDAESGRMRRVATRSVNSIDGDQRLNKALWLLAETTAAAKS
jgi:hypothetical protein